MTERSTKFKSLSAFDKTHRGTPLPPGEQHVLFRTTPLGEARAIITELAASLRTLSIGGVDLTQPYPENSTPPFADGIVLVPWPNRIPDGKWDLHGKPQRLDITEPERNNAIHGLLRNAPYRLLASTDDSVTLGATIFPQRGYPFLLETTVRYQLVDDGIRVTHGIRNDSSEAAPVAIGAHPFLMIGDVPTADLMLTVRAQTYFAVDDRLNLFAAIPVEATDYDLREGRRVGELDLDEAFGDIAPIDGVTALLRAPDGREVALWQDEDFRFVQVFTTPIFPSATGHTTAVAIEPMTAPANAFNTGEARRLEPGESWATRWGIRYSVGDSTV